MEITEEDTGVWRHNLQVIPFSVQRWPVVAKEVRSLLREDSWQDLKWKGLAVWLSWSCTLSEDVIVVLI